MSVGDAVVGLVVYDDDAAASPGRGSACYGQFTIARLTVLTVPLRLVRNWLVLVLLMIRRLVASENLTCRRMLMSLLGPVQVWGSTAPMLRTLARGMPTTGAKSLTLNVFRPEIANAVLVSNRGLTPFLWVRLVSLPAPVDSRCRARWLVPWTAGISRFSGALMVRLRRMSLNVCSVLLARRVPRPVRCPSIRMAVK